MQCLSGILLKLLFPHEYQAVADPRLHLLPFTFIPLLISILTYIYPLNIIYQNNLLYNRPCSHMVINFHLFRFFLPGSPSSHPVVSSVPSSFSTLPAVELRIDCFSLFQYELIRHTIGVLDEEKRRAGHR